MFINVLLPEPLEPMMATNSPGKISSEIPRTADVHFAGVIRLVDGVELHDGFCLHTKFFQEIKSAHARETAAAERICRHSGLRASRNRPGHNLRALIQT